MNFWEFIDKNTGVVFITLAALIIIIDMTYKYMSGGYKKDE